MAAPDWLAADKAYQLHHASCRACIGAGANPHAQHRCPDGRALWDAYINAGDPPQFAWLARERKLHERFTRQPQSGRGYSRGP